MANRPRRRPSVVSTEGGPVVLDAEESRTTATTEDTGGHVTRGHRPMKEFYVYDSEFRELKRTGAIATTLFALGSACMGFVVNTHLAIMFADKLSDQLKIEWAIYRNVGLLAAVVLYLFGTMQALAGYNEVERIKAETSHGGEKYMPKSRYKVAFWALAFMAVFALGIVAGYLWL